MFVYQVCVELLFFTSKIHIECQIWAQQRPNSPSGISLIIGQTRTLYIWLCDSLVPQSGKTPGVILVVWMLFFNSGSFFRLLCDWLESEQLLLAEDPSDALSFCWSLIHLWALQDSSVAALCSICTKWILLRLLGHLFIPPDILQGVEMLARRWGSRPDLPMCLQLHRKKGKRDFQPNLFNFV